MPNDLSDITTQLGRNTWSLAAIGIAAERGVLSAIAARPRTVAEIASLASLAVPTAAALVDVLGALGAVAIDAHQVRDAGPLAPYRDPKAAKVLAADLRSAFGTTRDAVYRAADEGAIEGWRAVDPVAVRAQGIVSQAATLSLGPMLHAHADLHARLSAPGARLLDVGAGAAGLGIAFATLYPTLRIVGIEPSEIACAEARAAIRDAGLDDRVEVRRAIGQDLAEEGAFTAAYVAHMFIPDDAIDAVFRATARALVKGGWLATGTIAIEGAELGPSVARFRSAIWGGGVRPVERVRASLERAGFGEIRWTPSTGVVPIFARRLPVDAR